MKQPTSTSTVALCWTALALLATTTLAKPNTNGVYHQEYNYRTQSSSYRNNELQHQNDDQGFYSKDGDLAGRLPPKVNAHSQHSEYVNPKLREQLERGGTLNEGFGHQQTKSFGQLSAQNQLKHGEFLSGMGGLAGNNAAYGGGSSYGFSGGSFQQGSSSNFHQSYGVNSNLNRITHQLEMELARELQQRIQDHYARTASYSTSLNQAQMESEMRFLEDELRHNLTMRMQDVLRQHYGSEGIRGSYSYSIVNGRLQPTPNYHSQELQDLTRQIEANLLRLLNEKFRTYYHTSSHQSTVTTHHTNTLPVYQPLQPMQPIHYQPSPIIQPRTHIIPIPIVPTPDSITTIASRVQSNLDHHLNKILEETQRRYFSNAQQYQQLNYDQILSQLQQELRENITYHFNEELRHSYGSQRYNIEDFETYRTQLERNLMEKLTRDFSKQKENFLRTHHFQVGSNSNRIFHTTGPMIYYPTPGNIVATPNQIEWVDTQKRRLQEDMTRQIQAALMEQQWRQQSQAYATANSQANYQAVLDRLTEELNRNLTRQMEYMQSQQNFGTYGHSGNYNAQLASMRNQLQQDLNRQLQQGLQQSFSRWSSWSSSAQSSSHNANFRPVRGFDPTLFQNYGTSSNLETGSDCMMGDDPSSYTNQQNDGDSTKQAADAHRIIPKYFIIGDNGELVEIDAAEHAKRIKEPTPIVKKDPTPLSERRVRRQIGDLFQQSEDDDLTQQLEDTDSIFNKKPNLNLNVGNLLHVNFGNKGNDDDTEDVHGLGSNYQSHSHQTTRRYYVIDASGNRRQVDADEYARLKNTSGLDTRKYYAIDATGKKTEIDAAEYARLLRKSGSTANQNYVTTSSGRHVEEQIARTSETITHASQVTRRYYITDSSGKRREVDAEEYAQFQKQHNLGSVFDTDNINSPSATGSGRSLTKITRRYYVIDASGNKKEVDAEEYERVRQGRDYSPVNQMVVGTDGQQVEEQVAKYQRSNQITRQPGTTSVHQITRKYYITDSSGQRREVDAEEYARYEKRLGINSVDTDEVGTTSTHQSISKLTRRYYVLDSSGNRREVDAEEYERLSKLNNAGSTRQHVISNSQSRQVEEDAVRTGSVSSQVTKRYYIIDSTGKRREVDAEEYARIQRQQNVIEHSETTIIRRYYIIDSSGNKREVDQEEYEKYRKRSNYGTTLAHTVDSLGQTTEEELVQPGIRSTQVLQKYYIVDSTGTKREVSVEEYIRFLKSTITKLLTRVNKKYYIPGPSDTRMEVTPEEYAQIEKTLHLVPQKQYIIDSFGRTVEKIVGQRTTTTSHVDTTETYYIEDSTGKPKEVTLEEFINYQRKLKARPSKLTTDSLSPDQTDLTPEPVDDSFLTQRKHEPKGPSSGSLTEQTTDKGQETDTSDLTQQTEDVDYGPQIADLTQSTVDTGYGKLEKPHSQKQTTELGQEPVDSDLTQQTEDVGFGPSQGGQQRPRDGPGFGKILKPQSQRPDNSDLSQQTEDVGYEPLEVGQRPQKPRKPSNADYEKLRNPVSQQQTSNLGQQPDDSDLTQQTEDVDYDRLQLGQKPDDLTQQTEDLTQQTVDTSRGKLQKPQSQNQVGQQPDDSDFTQQTEDVEYQPLQVGQRPKDLTQKPGYEKLQKPSFPQQTTEVGQKPDHSDLTQQTEDLTQQTVDTGYGRLQKPQSQLGQEPDDSDLTQQTEDVGYDRLQVGQKPEDLTQKPVKPGYGRLQRPVPKQQTTDLGQQPDDSDLTQQTEDIGYDRLQLGQKPEDLTQQTEDLTQQTVDTGYGKLRKPHSQNQLGQQPDDSDLTQQTEDLDYEPLQVGQKPKNLNQKPANTGYGKLQKPTDVGQQTEDLTQQTVDTGYGRLQKPHGTHLGQQPDHSDLTQQTEDLTQQTVDTGYGKLRKPHSQNQLGQQPDDSDLTQQTDDLDYEPLQVGQKPKNLNQKPANTGYGKLQKPTDVGQQTEDLTQQTVDTGYGRLQKPHGTHLGQQPDHSDLTQQTEDLTQQTVDTGYGKLRKPHSQNQLGQQPDDSDLTQQTEDLDYEPLQVGQKPKSLNQKPANTGYGKLQKPTDVGQQTEDLTQQTVDTGYGRLQKPQTQQHITHLGQQPDDSDLTQQTEDLTQQTVDTGYGKLQKPQSQRQTTELGQQPDDSDLTQQTEDVGYDNLQLGQQTGDLTQQTLDTGYGRLQRPKSQQHTNDFGQQPDDSDVTQQTEDLNYEPLQVGQRPKILRKPVKPTYGKPQTGRLEDSQLTQQTEDLTHQTLDTGYGRLENPHNQLGQGAEDSSLTQQTEDLTQQVEYPSRYPKPQRVQRPLTQTPKTPSQTQQEFEQPIEPEAGQKLEDLTRQQIGPQVIGQNTVDGNSLLEADRTSHYLIEKLRQKVQGQQQTTPAAIGPFQYHPRPVYGTYDIGDSQVQVPVGTTRGINNQGFGDSDTESEIPGYGLGRAYNRGFPVPFIKYGKTARGYSEEFGTPEEATPYGGISNPVSSVSRGSSSYGGHSSNTGGYRSQSIHVPSQSALRTGGSYGGGGGTSYLRGQYSDHSSLDESSLPLGSTGGYRSQSIYVPSQYSSGSGGSYGGSTYERSQSSSPSGSTGGYNSRSDIIPSHSSPSFSSYGSRGGSYGRSSQSHIKYGTPHQVDVHFETANAINEPEIKTQRARVVGSDSTRPRTSLDHQVVDEPEVPQEVEQTEEIAPSAGFWSRIGSKIKNTAVNVKEKIVG